MDIDSFKEAVDGIDDWFVNELKSQGYDDARIWLIFSQGFLQYSGKITVIWTGRKQPGTSLAPLLRQVPGLTADVSSVN